MTKLNRLLVGLLTAAGLTTAAFAQEATPWNPSDVQSTKTRAEVRAETVGIVHSGEVTTFADVGNIEPKSRAEVRAEAREALRLDQLGRGEANAFATL
jgi:hypothetical protein